MFTISVELPTQNFRYRPGYPYSLAAMRQTGRRYFNRLPPGWEVTTLLHI
jgi:hypothetical protein